MQRDVQSGEEASDSTASYARARRFLGIAYVGTIVLSCSLLLLAQVPERLFGASDQASASWFRNILLAVFAFELASFPFDIAGIAIERRFRKTKSTMAAHMPPLITAVFKHAILLLAVAFILTSAVHLLGALGLLCASLAMSWLFVWKQAEVARFYSNLAFKEPPNSIKAAYPQYRPDKLQLLLAETKERGFTGGIVGLPGHEAVIIPECWLDEFSERQLWALIARRNQAIKNGLRLRGLLTAVLFNTAGAVLSYFLTEKLLGLSFISSAGLASFSMLTTIWAFLGLLVLPKPTQDAVYSLDREVMMNCGVTQDLLSASALKLESFLEVESERSPLVESVFHPVPTAGNRQRRLMEPGTHESASGAWQCARYAVFISVLNLALLGRAVHCNAGKPDLWGMLPAD